MARLLAGGFLLLRDLAAGFLFCFTVVGAFLLFVLLFFVVRGLRFPDAEDLAFCEGII